MKFSQWIEGKVSNLLLSSVLHLTIRPKTQTDMWIEAIWDMEIVLHEQNLEYCLINQKLDIIEIQHINRLKSETLKRINQIKEHQGYTCFGASPTSMYRIKLHYWWCCKLQILSISNLSKLQIDLSNWEDNQILLKDANEFSSHTKSL